MTNHKKTLYLATFAILFASAQFALAQEGKKIYAQKLLDETLAKHKDVVIMAMHVTPPGKTDNVIIASNIGRIGKKADEDKNAEQIRDEMKQKTPTLAKLFESAN